MTATNTVTWVTFTLYIMGTFLLAWLSHRIISKRAFLGEYYLGSRGLGSWTLAFTFAATSASGGSFTGYPSLIYSHGWVLALWIGSYMIFPLCTMGVLGKRLNQVARKTGAITVPDILRDRFRAPELGLFATCVMIFFLVANLVGQFRAGALILATTFNLPTTTSVIRDVNDGELIGLLVFAVVVIFYTSYGGFRAVVWTDVMQGVVMGVGVLILVPLILYKAGGLQQVNKTLATQSPTVVTSLSGGNNDLAFLLKKPPASELPVEGVRYVIPKQNPTALTVQLVPDDSENYQWLEIRVVRNAEGNVTTTANEVAASIRNDPELDEMFDVKYAYENDGDGTWQEIVTESTQFPVQSEWTFLRGTDFLYGPGRRPNGLPFHTFGMIISFFVMWAITGMAQPGNLVRLIAFKDSKTLKRAILTVTVYFGLIYLPLVFVFVSARLLLPYLPQENSDKAMALIATRVVAADGSWLTSILAALLVAAPFAAVMSTVDSFLLMVSSGMVRDVYQRNVNPHANEETLKRASYTTTVIAGILVAGFAIRRIDFLQYIIVFTSIGLACTLIWPIFLGLNWKGMPRAGAGAAMVVGSTTIVGLFLPTFFGGETIYLFGFYPVVWGLLGSLAAAILVSYLTGPPPEDLVNFYFRVPKDDPSTEAVTGPISFSPPEVVANSAAIQGKPDGISDRLS
ncbi:MAG: hypothetical protein ACFCD0_02925 [Gemmataceae bacterium]